MSEMDIFMELLDEKMINFILREFFSDNNPKQNELVKRIKLQKLLRDPGVLNLKKAYRVKGESCIQIVKQNLADKELLDCGIADFSESILSNKKSTLSNLELFCTASIKFPKIIESNIETILNNNKNNEFLFKDVQEFNISSKSLDSIELKKVKENIIKLKEEIDKIKVESEQIREENNRLSLEKNEVSAENKQIKKEIKKNKKEIDKLNNLNEEIRKISDEQNLVIKEKEEQLKALKVKYELIKKEKNDIKIRYNELKNREYINIDDEVDDVEYSACLIYTFPIVAIKSIFKNILFIKYEDYLNDNKLFIEKLNKMEIKEVYIISNNISMKELGIFKRKIRNEGINYKTLLFSNDANLAKELINIKQIDSYELIY